MNIKNEIEEVIKKSLKDLNFLVPEKIDLDHPQDLKNGDFTTNIAMILAGKTGKNPRELGQEILDKLKETFKNTKSNLFGYSWELDFYIDWEKTKIDGPGYINIYLSKIFFRYYLESFTSNATIGGKNNDFKNNNYNGIVYDKKGSKKILLEHSSPNLFKPFHIGHMVNNSIGESLSRVFRFSGAKVKNISFPSDVSPGIAKTIWALKIKNKNNSTLTLGGIASAYVEGTLAYKENEGAKKEIDKINIEIYNKQVGLNWDFYMEGKKLSLNHFKEITKKLGSEFSDIIYESEAEKVGKEIVKDNIGRVFKESDGAIIFEGKNFTNVFVNSQGFGTYLAKDTGLLKIKQDKFTDIEKSLVLTDVEQKQHFEMVKESASQILEISEFVKKSEYLQHGRMTFSGNTKISSRYGNVPLATELIETVQKNILEKMKERDFLEEEKKDISEKLAIATLKYSILKVTSGKNISFDVEKDTSPQGNSATYLMYSLVRAKSILNKVDINLDKDVELKKNVTLNLEKMLYRLNEKVEKTLDDYSPHHIANFAFDLTVEFNRFYSETKVLDEENEDYLYNLKLVQVYRDKMEEIFNLLGIKTVEKM